MDYSEITCDETIDADAEAKSNDEAKMNDEETKFIPTNFNEKNITCKIQNFYTLLTFFLTTIALLIDVSTYCYLIKYRAKKQHFLPFHNTKQQIKRSFMLII